MLKAVSEGVWTHQSGFCQSNTVIVQGNDGVLLVDPGITGDELACLSRDLEGIGQKVIAGFSTHPHWDHLLWDARFGAPPRYATEQGAQRIHNVLSSPDWKARVSGMLPPDFATHIPLDDAFGQVSALPGGTTHIPWDGPSIHVIEHPAHAAGHAALLIEDSGILVAGDMLSDLLVPLLDVMAAHPTDEYLMGLTTLSELTPRTFIPGHGTPGDAAAFRARLAADRAYVASLHDGATTDDPRLAMAWVREVHTRQVQQLKAL